MNVADVYRRAKAHGRKLHVPRLLLSARRHWDQWTTTKIPPVLADISADDPNIIEDPRYQVDMATPPPEPASPPPPPSFLFEPPSEQGLVGLPEGMSQRQWEKSRSVFLPIKDATPVVKKEPVEDFVMINVPVQAEKPSILKVSASINVTIHVS